MAHVYPKIYFGNKVVEKDEAKLSVASSAVLYGLSVYTVFQVNMVEGVPHVFRLKDHFLRLKRSAKIIGIDTFEREWDYEKFLGAITALVDANETSERVFVRASVHVDEDVPGTRSRGLHSSLCIFMYEAKPILPESGAHIKTSVWRRIPDYAIPSRAKVNGAYVNSVLGKQDAIDSGYDDCLFLDIDGHVCELSAANIFIVRDGALITPAKTNDLLEGITRKTVLEIAKELGIETEERTIDLTELYVADEAFACGTSTFITPVIEIDARKIDGSGPLTAKIKKEYYDRLEGKGEVEKKYLTPLT